MQKLPNLLKKYFTKILPLEVLLPLKNPYQIKQQILASRLLTNRLYAAKVIITTFIITINFFSVYTLGLKFTGFKFSELEQQRESQIMTSSFALTPISETPKGNYEVFGFAPYWTFDKIDNIDFQTLTTLAYFGVEINSSGDIITNDPGYQTLMSDKASKLFKKAKDNQTRVVLTVTQMNNAQIRAIMDDPPAQENAINQIVDAVKSKELGGVNVDFEYSGNPGDEYRNKFSNFVEKLTSRMHQEVPNSKVTVSVYASAVKEPKIYDIGKLSEVSDGIFMMAYDFAVASSDQAMPTAPLYGYKEGRYWYDVSTAVEDFLAHMPAEKLILGVPWYGYNYAVSHPEIKAGTGWFSSGVAQTYAHVVDSIHQNMDGIDYYAYGWDKLGEVGWKAYRQAGVWRMIFAEDERSLERKYQFAKDKNLAGVGIWALGFEEDKQELWKQLKEEFKTEKLSDSSAEGRRMF